MIVTIPSKEEHKGYYKASYEISDKCPICGENRGHLYGTVSFDGSRKMLVDGWRNPCGHIDKYSDVRKEGKLVEFKEPTPILNQLIIKNS